MASTDVDVAHTTGVTTGAHRHVVHEVAYNNQHLWDGIQLVHVSHERLGRQPLFLPVTRASAAPVPVIEKPELGV